MYLKEIATNGFKSFADKIELKLDGKITCIVGPNGSGKSNVVDAVRWVLGEQSVKSLRGDGSMSDVIFSGSKSRKPLNVASVELIFDNSDHFLNVPYEEISIKRRVYRSGENEYYLNNERCRLKDINNLLIDTGLTKESYNIISQGEVERIFSSSANDRRLIFEEASGILKYKKRKEESLRKLDRTHTNLDRVNDIISELELQVTPLKEQSEKAKEYLESKKELDHYEVALLAYDIENANFKLEQENQKKEKLEQEIITLANASSKEDATFLEDNNKLDKLEQEQNKLSQDLLLITEEVEKINGEKNLLKERSKTTKEENQIKEEMRTILDQKSKTEGRLTTLKEHLKLLINDSNKTEQRTIALEEKMKEIKTKKNMLTNTYSKQEQELISLKHKISSLNLEIEQGKDMPNSVRSILKDNTLSGIYNTIGNILSIDDKYVKALNIAISANKNFIITKDEQSAEEAIRYLKERKLGRATFFPLTVIKPRYIDVESLQILKKDESFIGIMSDLVKYHERYDNIIKNQLGTVILATDIKKATNLSHNIKAKYKIITLDGDVVNVGGAMSGGSNYQAKSVIMIRQELNHAYEKEKQIKQESQELTKELTIINEEISNYEEESFKISKEKVTLKEKYDNKIKEIKECENTLGILNQEWESLELMNKNSISDKEQELIQKFREKSSIKDQLQLKINTLKKEIDTLKQAIEETQADKKLKNSTLRAKEKSMNDLEISINRLEVKLDNLLRTLNEEYEMTFEKAKQEYTLDIEVEEARATVNKHKANIKRIGMVNLASIEEYERVNTRYVFLLNQKEDLLKAEDTLLEIMNEMDTVMEEEFAKTFYNVQREFQSVFNELFKGGQADLKLTDPTNLLTTGIEIVASPPGKKLTTISLLSGGEKTLTAISLLFAILNVKTVPFCLFDEVEAALDEANVAQFGKYLNHYKDKTQFLIITHKKKTMEYANTLYGITMQESGVSKLVSVKLTDQENFS